LPARWPATELFNYCEYVRDDDGFVLESADRLIAPSSAKGLVNDRLGDENCRLLFDGLLRISSAGKQVPERWRALVAFFTDNRRADNFGWLFGWLALADLR
jgi:hypothetical protein